MKTQIQSLEYSVPGGWPIVHVNTIIAEFKCKRTRGWVVIQDTFRFVRITVSLIVLMVAYEHCGSIGCLVLLLLGFYMENSTKTMTEE